MQKEDKTVLIYLFYVKMKSHWKRTWVWEEMILIVSMLHVHENGHFRNKILRGDNAEGMFSYYFQWE